MKKLLSIGAAALALVLLGRLSVPLPQATEAQWVTVIRDGKPMWVEVAAVPSAAPTETELPTPTPEVYPSATPQPSMTAWPTPTKVPSPTPLPVSTVASTPSDGCAAFPCTWSTYEWDLRVQANVWICTQVESPFKGCGTDPARQIKLREAGQVFTALCVIQFAEYGDIWVSEQKCGSSSMGWSAYWYQGRQYIITLAVQ